ncbi:MAG TPA: alkaline phosphatase family protein [Vicinamibacterales bacterium]|nr:alkaline phosphatase family protein [Vicinamibacterales bacterium]
MTLAVLASCALYRARAQSSSHTHLVIVVDGLRPDYVTEDVMPRLSRLGRRGIVFTAHHSVFPTVTRVNASSFVTGAYPETHGLLGNEIYIPATGASRVLDTGERANLEAVERADGRLLTAPTLGEILQRAGRKLIGISSGSTGSAYLLNHAVGGVVLHSDYTKPPELAPRVLAALGAPPAHATPNDPQNQRAIDAYLKLGVDDLRPDVTLLWLNDPDGTAHANGIGAPLTKRSLALVDAGIGRIEDGLRARGRLDSTNIIVTSDHGFSTETGELHLAALIAPFAATMADGSKDIVVAEGAIYLRSTASKARLTEIVEMLKRRPEVGAIFTRPGRSGQMEGVVPGTLSFDVARWNHPRSGDILVSANWSHKANEFGFKGTTTQEGVAGHGTSSPYDIHNTLMAAGPDFRENATSDLPTANVDIAPTLLRLLGIPAPPTMTGRVIEEGLRTAAPIRFTRTDNGVVVGSARSGYELSAHFSMVNDARYLDYTEVKRR